MWKRFRQWLCWMLQGRDEMERLFTVLTAEPGDRRCAGCRRNEWEEECMKTLKCKVCGNEIIPNKASHYIAVDPGQAGFVTAFRKDENETYDAFDCDVCGCQYIAQERKRVFFPEALMIGMRGDDEEDEGERA